MNWFINMFWKLYGKVFGLESESEEFFEAVLKPLLQYGHTNGISPARLRELWGEAYNEADFEITSPATLLRDKIMVEVALNYLKKYEV